MGGKKGAKKRFWSDEEKRSICGQARVPGVSIAQVARRYAMNANLLHKWLKDPRFVPEEDEAVSCDEDIVFLPVEVEGLVAPPPYASALPVSASVPGAPICAQRVDITLSDGRRILMEGSTALTAVLSMIEGLVP